MSTTGTDRQRHSEDVRWSSPATCRRSPPSLGTAYQCRRCPNRFVPRLYQEGASRWAPRMRQSKPCRIGGANGLTPSKFRHSAGCDRTRIRYGARNVTTQTWADLGPAQPAAIVAADSSNPHSVQTRRSSARCSSVHSMSGGRIFPPGRPIISCRAFTHAQ